jgi:hypothetical protein
MIVVYKTAAWRGHALTIMHRIRTFAIAFAVVVAVPSLALAWGPGMHMAVGNDVLQLLQVLPAGVAALLWKHRRDFLFGNIAADVVVGKRLSRVKQVCHHWETGFDMLDEARTKRARAFAYGYLSHLAADTVAHNKYVPRQVLKMRSAIHFSHLYWEIRADAAVDPSLWPQMRELLSEVASLHRPSLHARLAETFLPFSLNWRLFGHLNRIATKWRWRRLVTLWNRASRHSLPEVLIGQYRHECVARVCDVLIHGREAQVCYEDPNGNAALTCARHRRRLLRQIARAGVVAPHIYQEAVLGQAPAILVEQSSRRYSA